MLTGPGLLLVALSCAVTTALVDVSHMVGPHKGMFRLPFPSFTSPSLPLSVGLNRKGNLS